MVRFAKKRFFAVAPFHYPDGVVAKGETAELDPQTASRGLESGALVEIDAVASENEE